MKTFLNSQWTEAVGLTILDSLWQGALVLLFCFFILLFMKKARPAYRFNLVLIALISLPMLSGITLYRHLDFSQVESSVPLEVSIDFTSVPQDFIATDSPKTVAIEPLAKQSPYSFWLRWTAQNADIALAIWLIGALLFTIRMLGGFIFLNRLKTKAKLIEDSALLINLDQFCKQLKIKGKVLLKQSEAISSPLVMGVLKPVIIFPLGLIQALPTEEIEAILLHELAHIKRNDFLINIVINVLQVVYFYHPAFWWLNAQLDDEREYDCDESTVLLTSNPLVLAKALTRISEFNLQPSTPALAFAGRRNQMLKRIKRIVQRQPQTNWLSGLLSFSLLLLSFFLMSTNTGMNDNLNLEEKAKDPIEVQKVQFQDTAKINKAILEILKPNSRISIRPNENGGRPLIFLDKEEITGEEYAIYLAAYDQIQDFSKEISSEYSRTVKLNSKNKADSARNESYQIKINGITENFSNIEIDLDSISINNGIVESALKGTGLRVERLNKKDSDFTAKIMFNGELDTNNNKILFEINGEILNDDRSIKQLDTNLIQNISLIKNKSEIARLSLDTTLVEGIIRIVTKPNVDWKAATKSSSLRVRLRGITVITVKDEKSDQERIRDREPIKVPVEVDGVRGASLEDINPADIKSLSVIKNDAELHERNYDTTQVEGIIIIETNKVGKRKVEERLQGKSTFSITTESPDYSIVLFDDVVPEKFQFDAISRQLKDTKPMIEMDGKLYPEMTFKDLSDFGVAKLKIMEIFKGDKMYDFYKKRELKGRDVLLKIITK
jgi:beta-lactamase regulating signal transducer with metallopeptidase domain